MKNWLGRLDRDNWQRSPRLLAADSALIAAATLSALVLRDNFEPSAVHLAALYPYLGASLFIGMLVFHAGGANRMMWRFFGLPDYLHVTGAIAVMAASASAICFAYNRLDGIARSLPLLQFLTCTAFLTFARVLHRWSHANKQKRRAREILPRSGERQFNLTVLLVGATSLAETYLQAAAELSPVRISVAGVLDCRGRDEERLLDQRCLGSLEDIEQILKRLQGRGIEVDRVVIAAPLGSFSAVARAALLRAQRERSFVVQSLAEDLGFSNDAGDVAGTEAKELRFKIAPLELVQLAESPYWQLKRILDWLLASLFLLLFSPVMLLTALAVWVSMGPPIIFWQLRPGLGGKPFWLYKFRTMRPARSEDGRMLRDSERVTFMGTLLRRLRLDELPQLFNILRGDMSFVGPRPLLPKDQSHAFRTRLMVRPGLTGWAQIAGGRDISPVDKAALDVWYVRNASFVLDLKIALRTVPVVLFGERIRMQSIDLAWRELAQADALVDGV